MKSSKLLQVENLSVSFKSEEELSKVIRNISFELNDNEILGIVGESGSGKSVTSLALMGLLPKINTYITSEKLLFQDLDLSSLSTREFEKIRGSEIAMIFQEPMSSLNPSMRCGRQVAEILERHTKLTSKEIQKAVFTLFEQVKLINPDRVFNAYPHEISGGQKQRVMIAMAIACKPKILIADEPTTALDVTVQKSIIKLLKELQDEVGMSIIFISHDLALVSEIADRIVVMYKGEIVEQGTTVDIFNSPENTYTEALLKSRPSLDYRLKRLPTISDFMANKPPTQIVTTSDRLASHAKLYAQSPILEIRNLDKSFFSKSGWFSAKSVFKAVNNVSFKLYEGETLGLVGESGCGKSTLSNAILQLDKATAGSIFYNGNDITNLNKSDLRKLRKDIQIIFQDPYASLNPRIPIGKAIMEPMKVHKIGKTTVERQEMVKSLLGRVGLNEDYFYRYPHEFSGGQRQRIGIARTIALKPKLIICDESVSALDISVQAQVLNLLNELKEDFNFTYIFISHDLAVVKYMADQLIVMNKGEIEEMGDADIVYENPEKEYTQKLIHAIPRGF